MWDTSGLEFMRIIKVDNRFSIVAILV